jgi:hypothetical protein
MTGWMLQPGATFSARVYEEDTLDETEFSYHAKSWMNNDELVAHVRNLD